LVSAIKPVACRFTVTIKPGPRPARTSRGFTVTIKPGPKPERTSPGGNAPDGTFADTGLGLRAAPDFGVAWRDARDVAPPGARLFAIRALLLRLALLDLPVRFFATDQRFPSPPPPSRSEPKGRNPPKPPEPNPPEPNPELGVDDPMPLPAAPEREEAPVFAAPLRALLPLERAADFDLADLPRLADLRADALPLLLPAFDFEVFLDFFAMAFPPGGFGSVLKYNRGGGFGFHRLRFGACGKCLFLDPRAASPALRYARSYDPATSAQ
jgi:hypothetical protein